MSAGKKKVIRGLRRKAEALGVDVSGLTDEQLEAQIRDNTKRLADRAAFGVRSAVRRSVSRIAELGKALTGPEENR